MSTMGHAFFAIFIAGSVYKFVVGGNRTMANEVILSVLIPLLVTCIAMKVSDTGSINGLTIVWLAITGIITGMELRADRMAGILANGPIERS